MITRITGKLIRFDEDSATLGVEAFEYQVLIPVFVRQQLHPRLGKQITLDTIQYLEGNPAQGRLVPRLVGFHNDVEREFFELFCSVDGVGVRKALRAMQRPVPEVASWIEEQDVQALSSLPGIGPATAERIIAKLRRKVPKFALLITERFEEPVVEQDVVSETLDVLRSLGHSETDARRLIEATLKSKKRYKDVQALLQAVYEHSHRAADAT